MPDFVLPYLEPEALIVVLRRRSEADASHPLFALFTRKGQRSPKVKLRYLERKANALRHTSWGGPAVPVRRGKITEKLAEPAVLKVFDTLTAEDLLLFTDAAKYKAANDDSPLAQATIQEANDRILEIGNALADDLMEERHRLMVGAMLGEVDVWVYDATTPTTVSWGLTNMDDVIATPWDQIAAPIIQNMYALMSRFADNNALGKPPNAVAFPPSLWEDAFLKNTEWKEYTKLVPELAKGFMGIRGGQNPFSTEGMVDSLFGLAWIPMRGTYQAVDGTIKNRWPSNKLVFLRLGPDGARPRWQMVFHPLMNPNAEINVEISEPKKGDDVKTYKIVAFENGLPIWEEPQLVQPVTIFPAA